MTARTPFTPSMLIRLRAALLALVWVLLAVTAGRPAFAQDADSAFNEGMKQMAQGNYDAACDAFKKSEVPEPTMASRYQLGTCNEKRQRYASARRAYLDAADLAAKKGDKKRANVARQRAAELEAKVPLLLVVVTAEQLVEGLKVEHNGEDVPSEKWNTPLMVDPGEHAVRFSAPGRQPALLSLKATSAGQVTRAVLPTLAAGSAGAPLPNPTPLPGDTVSKGGPTTLFWVGVGLTGAGALFAIGGAVDLATSSCDGDVFCEDFVGEDNGLAIAGLVIGGAMLAVGIPFMVVGWESDEEAAAPASAGSVEALVGPTSAGLRVRF